MSSHCPRCAGTGTVPCPRCAGTGTEITLAVIATNGPHRHGRGEIKCPRCAGPATNKNRSPAKQRR